MAKSKKKEENTKEEEDGRFIVTSVPTQTRPVIKDSEEDKLYDELSFLCILANKIEKIERSILG